MKVCELIETLQALDPDMKVIVSGDAEGNTYNFLAVAEASDYILDGRQIEVCHPDDVQDGEYEGWELHQALVLWPC